MKYIVEYGIPGAVKGCETIEDIQRYLNTDPHPDARLASLLYNGVKSVILVWETDGGKAEHDRKVLIEACKEAYRKHAMNDSDIGWAALADTLGTVLAEVLGDKEFNRWTEELNPEKTV